MVNDVLKSLYLRLPGAFRSAAASLYGLKLRSWRYGTETEYLVQQALERERWSSEQWNSWQQERLAYVLHRAATRVPYYREQWGARRRKGDCSSWEYLENWPLLPKEPLRSHAKAFVADDCDPKKMFLDHTGGTTGTPLKLWVSRKVLRSWHAIFEARGRRWNSVSREENWATLGGQAVAPSDANSPPFWVWNASMKQLYISANHVSERNTSHYLRALNDYRITHIVGYPSSLAVLAAHTLKLSLPRPTLKVILTMAESVTPQQRDILRAAFGCEVRETYGMGELVAMATECGAGTFHLWPEVGYLEVFDDKEDKRLPEGSSGRFVCTSLINPDMPLVRYVVGDRGCIAETPSCECGRTLPVLSAIEGRTNDLLLSPDGRQVYWLNPVFYGLPLIEAQIIQETLDQIRILCVPDQRFAKEHEYLIIDRLRDRMGNVNVTVDRVATIPRSMNGKFRGVVCKISKSDSLGAEPRLTDYVKVEVSR